MVGVVILVVLAALYTGATWWVERRDGGLPGTGLLVGFWRHGGGLLDPGALVAYALAVAATFLLAHGGGDAPIQAWMQREDPLGSTFSWAVLVVGNFWPLLIALALYFLGRLRDPRRAGAGVAAFQALAATFLWVMILKIVTGRTAPHHFFDGEPLAVAWRTTADPSDFSFAFWTHAALDGRFMWPSGHTASAIAFVSALVAYGPRRLGLTVLGYAAVALTALAMVDGDFHWTSDVVAGALIGHTIGWSFGRAVRDDPRYAPPPPSPVET
ncbi:MAG: phosphatase PAP2 family protein [Deltaproteobacteria bacterium]|nr:MAG: phosphatase PAP2 family protein [Deltaproteobacteria bacterium]